MYKLAQRNAFFSEVMKMDLTPFGNKLFIYGYHQVRARRALLFKDVTLRISGALSLLKTAYMYGDSALLALNETALNSVSALLALG